MSLRDTIRGARDEAAANVSARSKSGDEQGKENAGAEQLDAEERQGFSKKSISRARPAREAAVGVRYVDAKGNSRGGKVPVTKEEKKAARRRENDLQDMRATVSNILLEQNPEYAQRRRTWWIIMGIGFGAMIVTLIIYGVATQQANDATAPLGFASIVLMVIAYGCIIGALIYDWVRVRPLRKAGDAVASGMSVKKMESLLDQDARERAQKKAQKASKNKGK